MPGPALRVETLEERSVPAATPTVAAGTLTVNGDAADDRIDIIRDGDFLVVRDREVEIFRTAAAGVGTIVVNGNDGDDILQVADDVSTPATLTGGGGMNKLRGGAGNTTLVGGTVADVLVGGNGANTVTASGEAKVYRVRQADRPQVVLGGQARAIFDQPAPLPIGSLGVQGEPLLAAEVGALLDRASAATATNDAIIAIVDRNGRVLGVRVEDGVSPLIRNDPALLAFAIDGAVAKARTAAFFASNQAPLTSRTIQNLSETTMTDREINSNPNDTNPNSTTRGPGFVAAVGTKGHFPNGVVNTPQVDLFGIEHTNRDGTFHVGNDNIKGMADDVRLDQRFNIDPNFVPAGNSLFPMDSYGFESNTLRGAQSRGIGTLPGGIPIYKKNAAIRPFGVELVGGIGTFFPGTTGFATEENSELSSTFDPTRPDRTLEAEVIGLIAVGGVIGGDDNVFNGAERSDLGVPIGGVALPDTISSLPIIDSNQRIDLVGLNLDIIGRNGTQFGVKKTLEIARAIGAGRVNGTNQVVDVDGEDNVVGNADDLAAGDPRRILRDGKVVPEGWLVVPHDGVGITAAQVTDIITNGLAQAYKTRAAIRLPLGSFSGMVLAVCDKEGNVVGLYRMPDATIFSIDVAVAKSRNVNYYADATQLDPRDQVDGVAPGVAFTNRTFRYLALPRFPESFDQNSIPGQFSQLYDGTFDRVTGISPNPALPASAFQSVLGFDSFNPGTNFKQTANKLNQNGIVFFPGSVPLYFGGQLIGGFGISGDGVDQDDVVTGAGQQNFLPNDNGVVKADQVFTRGIRLPYQKHNRNPEG